MYIFWKKTKSLHSPRDNDEEKSCIGSSDKVMKWVHQKNFKPQIVENVWSFNTNLWPHKDKQTIATSKRIKTTMEKND